MVKGTASCSRQKDGIILVWKEGGIILRRAKTCHEDSSGRQKKGTIRKKKKKSRIKELCPLKQKLKLMLKFGYSSCVSQAEAHSLEINIHVVPENLKVKILL